jgi:hypothetical protein
LSYEPGHFTKPVRLWFGRHWTPKCSWEPPRQRATRTSEHGDSFNLKGTPAKWVKTKELK